MQQQSQQSGAFPPTPHTSTQRKTKKKKLKSKKKLLKNK